MNTSEEMRNEIGTPEELERVNKEEGEIKDESSETVTGGYYIPTYNPQTGHISDHGSGRKPIA